MGRTRRSLNNDLDLLEIGKRQKSSAQRRAQRKFASGYPVGPTAYEKLSCHQNLSLPKVEDFLEFLCVRHTHYMPHRLEVFAEPLVTPTVISNEAFNSEVSDTEDTQSVMSQELDTSEDKYNPKVVIEKHHFTNGAIKLRSSDGRKKGISETNLKLHEFKDFFQMLEILEKSNIDSVFLITPPSEWKVTPYPEQDLNFQLKIKHLERFRNPYCDNFITYQCIKKQLENESIILNEIPQVSFFEIDLPVLDDLVSTYGGVETVNSSHNWKLIADQLNIPKTASRRATKIEELYFKYVLPYALLTDKDKVKLRNSVAKSKSKLSEVPLTYAGKTVTLVNFHKIACYLENMFANCKNDLENLENEFWDIMEKGNRHVGVISGMVDTGTLPVNTSQKKTGWTMASICNSKGSALKYLGKKPGITDPVLLFEGIFSTSEWCVVEDHFHLISYLHSGTPKIWYVVSKYGTQMIQKRLKKSRTLLDLQTILDEGYDIERVVQREGQYVIIKPNCFYLTISAGYSCSEMVYFAPISWLRSEYFRTKKLNLKENHLITMLLNLIDEDPKKRSNAIHVERLIEKTNELKNLINKTLNKLKTVGITEVNHAEEAINEASICANCGCPCILISIIDMKDNDPTFYCVTDILKMAKENSLKKNEMSIEISMTVEELDRKIERLELKHSPNKKKKVSVTSG